MNNKQKVTHSALVTLQEIEEYLEKTKQGLVQGNTRFAQSATSHARLLMEDLTNKINQL